MVGLENSYALGPQDILLKFEMVLYA
jgi:hypothetical protein